MVIRFPLETSSLLGNLLTVWSLHCTLYIQLVCKSISLDSRVVLTLVGRPIFGRFYSNSTSQRCYTCQTYRIRVSVQRSHRPARDTKTRDERSNRDSGTCFWYSDWYQPFCCQPAWWKNCKGNCSNKFSFTGEVLTLREAQSLTDYLSFCAKVVRVGWVFMRPLWTFVATYPRRR